MTSKTFDVQSVELPTNFEKAFSFISNPANLPKWTAAFKEADENSAVECRGQWQAEQENIIAEMKRRWDKL